ncbi:MAG: TetR/AcrR family transcriptional regulator [Candidatus Pseudobacter hemicellulosilyticus]|uniref:TetR/AcrR family transcriptional regulator n=1 Tax=Candidatus Pseudobacter hemicellulosilyticus TaxID=3121375 RepID=A0AAJ6BG41_9BACT|nr:MAG: TetR/AcrR family transcriptional regulator [Pseudobacter sp.]
MSKAEKTRQFIIEKTAPIFNKKGFAATSLNDLTAATGLTKGSIYGNFENKDAVAQAAYRYNADQLAKAMELAISKASTPLDKLLAVTGFYRKQWKTVFISGGCPSLNAAAEADDTFPAMLEEVKLSFDRLAKRIAGIMEAGKKDGSFRANIKSTEYTYLFIMLIEGGILLSKTARSPKHLLLALDHVEKTVKEEIQQ